MERLEVVGAMLKLKEVIGRPGPRSGHGERSQSRATPKPVPLAAGFSSTHRTRSSLFPPFRSHRFWCDRYHTTRLLRRVVSYLNIGLLRVRNVQCQFHPSVGNSETNTIGPLGLSAPRVSRVRASPCTPNLPTLPTPASRTHAISSTGRSPSSNTTLACSQL
jgi:hypothetical protein